MLVLFGQNNRNALQCNTAAGNVSLEKLTIMVFVSTFVFLSDWLVQQMSFSHCWSVCDSRSSIMAYFLFLQLSCSFSECKSQLQSYKSSICKLLFFQMYLDCPILKLNLVSTFCCFLMLILINHNLHKWH